MAKARGKKNNLFKHGAHSMVKRYQEGKIDRRTSLGKYIEDMKQSIVQEIGILNAPQEILLQLIMQKIVFISAIAEYCNGQGSQVVNNRGELLPCLSKSYIAFSNALVRDIKALYELQEIKKQTARESDDDGYLQAVMGKV